MELAILGATLGVTLCALLTFMAWQMKQVHEERKDMLDRIMTRSWEDYSREKRIATMQTVEKEEESLSYFDQ